MGESVWATKSLLYSWHIHMRRAWSLAKHSAPPESLAGLLSPREQTRITRARKLEREYTNVLLLERRAHHLEDARLLRKDLIFLDAPAVRTIFEFYARDRYSHTSKSAQQSLMAHIRTLPDNKIVEDIHQPLRLDARANMNKRMSTATIQNVIMKSRVLEDRGIQHHCRVDKKAWVKNFVKTRVRKALVRHRAPHAQAQERVESLDASPKDLAHHL